MKEDDDIEIIDRREAKTWQDTYIDQLLEKIEDLETKLIESETHRVRLSGVLADIEYDAREATEQE